MYMENRITDNSLKKGKQCMEENNKIIGNEELETGKEKLVDDMKDLLNIVQLLALTLESNEEDEHIIRSVYVIEKMVRSIMDNDLM